MKTLLLATAFLAISASAYAQDTTLTQAAGSHTDDATALTAGEATVKGLSSPSLASWSAVMLPGMKQHLYDDLLHPKGLVECPVAGGASAGAVLTFEKDASKCSVPPAASAVATAPTIGVGDHPHDNSAQLTPPPSDLPEKK